jgi:hypothetical protein
VACRAAYKEKPRWAGSIRRRVTDLFSRRRAAKTYSSTSPRSRELHRQWRSPAAEFRAGISWRGASLRQRRDAARQVRWRLRLAFINLRRNGDVPIQVVRKVTRTSSSFLQRPLGVKLGPWSDVRCMTVFPRKRKSIRGLAMSQTCQRPTLHPSLG